jgi:hypothetical protein
MMEHPTAVRLQLLLNPGSGNSQAKTRQKALEYHDKIVQFCKKHNLIGAHPPVLQLSYPHAPLQSEYPFNPPRCFFRIFGEVLQS